NGTVRVRVGVTQGMSVARVLKENWRARCPLTRDALQRERVAGVRERGVYALASLLDGTLRQSDGGESGEAVRDVGFDVYQIGVDPEHRGGADEGEHG